MQKPLPFLCFPRSCPRSPSDFLTPSPPRSRVCRSCQTCITSGRCVIKTQHHPQQLFRFPLHLQSSFPIFSITETQTLPSFAFPHSHLTTRHPHPKVWYSCSSHFALFSSTVTKKGTLLCTQFELVSVLFAWTAQQPNVSFRASIFRVSELVLLPSSPFSQLFSHLLARRNQC